MTENHKKTLEWKFLMKFLPFLKLPVGSIIPSETPDFHLKIHRGNGIAEKISIEVTRIINQDLIQIEAAQERIIKEAQRKFKLGFPHPIEVFVEFSDASFEVTPQSIDMISSQLVEHIFKIHRNNKDYKYRVETRSRFHRYFNSISVKNDDWFENWQTFGAFIVPHIDQTLITSRIESKEKRLPLYKDTYQANWLLLVTNFGHESSAFQFQKLMVDTTHSSFDKIYLFKYFEEEIIELK